MSLDTPGPGRIGRSALKRSPDRSSLTVHDDQSIEFSTLSEGDRELPAASHDALITPSAHEDGPRSASAASIASFEDTDALKKPTSYVPNTGSLPSKAQRTGGVKAWYRWTKTTWIWEIVATIASLFCQGAIVVILASMHDKPLSRWTATVSINAFVATLTTAAKSLMLFVVAGCVGQLKWIYFESQSRRLYHLELLDKLSRGPLGAAQSLFRVRWGAGYLAMVITLLALAIDPFTQQVVNFAPAAGNDPDPSINFWTNQNYTFDQSANGEAGMQAAVLAGLYDIKMAGSYSCTSDCLWPGPIVSLGFASDCHDVTAEMMQSRSCAPEQPEGESCKMLAPSKQEVYTVTNGTSAQTALTVAIERLGVFQSSYYPGGDDNVSPKFLNVYIVRSKPIADLPAHVDIDIALECSLRVAAFQYSDIRVSGANEPKIEPTHMIELKDGKTPVSMYPSITFQPDGLPALGVDWAALNDVIDFFGSDPFSGNVTAQVAGGLLNSGLRSPLLTGDIAAKFDAISGNLTQYVRSASGSQPVHGLHMTNDFHVRVQWEWLVLFFFESLATIALLTWTVLWNRRLKGLELWKDSSLALLFSECKTGDGLLRPSAQGRERIEEVAKRARVVLE